MAELWRYDDGHGGSGWVVGPPPADFVADGIVRRATRRERAWYELCHPSLSIVEATAGAAVWATFREQFLLSIALGVLAMVVAHLVAEILEPGR